MTTEIRVLCLVRLVHDEEFSANDFHFENGWIVTNSRVLGENHAFLAKITIKFHDENGNLVVLPPRKRFAFHLNIPDNSVTIANQIPDIAMFRLNDDEPRPAALNSSVDICGYYSMNRDDHTLTYWYDGEGHLQQSEQEHVQIGHALLYRTTYEGISGSCGAPVFDQVTGHLVAVQFAESDDGRALAVPFRSLYRIFSGQIAFLVHAQRLAELLQQQESNSIEMRVVKHSVDCTVAGVDLSFNVSYIKLLRQLDFDSPIFADVMGCLAGIFKGNRYGIQPVPVIPPIE